MRILFDHGTPAPLRRALTGHTVSTAHEKAWAQLDNGALLRAAEAQFDVLITTDRNLRHQQNIAKLHLAILILPTTSWPRIRARESQVLAAVNALRPGDVVELKFS
jgi:hypothetical protein